MKLTGGAVLAIAAVAGVAYLVARAPSLNPFSGLSDAVGNLVPQLGPSGVGNITDPSGNASRGGGHSGGGSQTIADEAANTPWLPAFLDYPAVEARTFVDWLTGRTASVGSDGGGGW